MLSLSAADIAFSAPEDHFLARCQYYALAVFVLVAMTAASEKAMPSGSMEV